MEGRNRERNVKKHTEGIERFRKVMRQREIHTEKAACLRGSNSNMQGMTEKREGGGWRRRGAQRATGKRG